MSSIYSSMSNCYTPYTKLSQSSSDSSCCSMTDERYASCRPNKVIVINGSSPTEKSSSMFVTKPIKGLLSITPETSSREYDAKVFDILLVDPDDFATQITLMDWPVFKSITVDELTSCAWNVKCKLQKAYNVVQFIRRFNHTNFWVQKEILHAQSHKSRVEVLSRMIKVAKKLLEINNINGLMAVVTALLSAPIYRLESCWSSISRRDRLSFNSLAELVSEEENRRRLRRHLAMTTLPCIPFIGLYLTDLIYIDTLHPHHGGMESAQRKIQMNNICRVISEFQQSDYSFLKQLSHVQSYLSSVRYIEELQKFAEDENYKLSLTIEPMVKDKLNYAQCHMSPSSVRSDIGDHKIVETDSKKLQESNKNISPYGSLPSSIQSSCKQDLLNVGSSNKESISSKPSIQNSLKIYRWLPGIYQGRRRNSQTKSIDISIVLDKYMSPVLRNNCKFNCEDSTNQCEHDGFVMIKQILKAYKKPTLCRWQRIWMIFLDQHLLFFKLKTLGFLTLSAMTANTTNLDANSKSALRNLFMREPYRCYSITGRCMVVSCDPSSYDDVEVGNKSNNSNDESTFQLNDLNKGNIFKFKTRSKKETHDWYILLQEAIQKSRRNLEKNLMVFD